MRIVLTGGGTGGHAIPNLAVIEELKKSPLLEIKYIGSDDGIEKNILNKKNIDYVGIKAGKLRRYFSVETFFDFLKIPFGLIKSRKILKEFKPDVVFSKGGYVSFPVVVAAYFQKIPVIVHESDVVPGLANMMSFKMAKKICVSFEESRKYLKDVPSQKIVVTGNPVRESIKHGDALNAYRLTGLDRHRPVILVVGGSQGAEQINELIRVSLDELLKKYQIIHLVGRGKLDISIHKKGYAQYEYLDEQMKDVYAITDLVVSRGGANALSEIAFLKKKAVIIPLGTASSRGDQIENSKYFVDRYGWSLLGGNITREDFINAIRMAFNQDQKNVPAFVNGASPIVDIILNKGK